MWWRVIWIIYRDAIDLQRSQRTFGADYQIITEFDMPLINKDLSNKFSSRYNMRHRMEQIKKKKQPKSLIIT